MKTLWLHGMGGKPNQEKIAYMESQGLKMHALHLDYNHEPRSFEILRDYIVENSIEFMVGSSHGGFLAFWLNEELNIPCLLLNPAVSISLKRKTKPDLTGLKGEFCIVALGALDQQVDAQRTLKFMDKDRREGKKIITRVWENEGHGFTMEAFHEILKWGLDELENFR